MATLFRPVGQPELDLIVASGWTAFPPRLDWQPIFYPVLTEDYATRIARDWNTADDANGGVGYVLRFEVDDSYITGPSCTRREGASTSSTGSRLRNFPSSTITSLGSSRSSPSGVDSHRDESGSRHYVT